MTLACPLLVAVHTAAASWAAHAPALQTFSTVHPASRFVMLAAEPAVSRAKEVLDDAKNEEEELYDKELAEASAASRSADSIAQQKKDAEAALAALAYAFPALRPCPLCPAQPLPCCSTTCNTYSGLLGG